MTTLIGSAARSPLDAAARALANAMPPAEIAFDVPLASLGRWQIGGPADIVVTPTDAGSLALTLRLIADLGVPHIILGDGSNLLFDNAGFRGVVIRIGRAFDSLTLEDDGVVVAGAGWWVPSFVRHLINAGLSGAVHAIGIPGTLGGLVTMNGGSQRKGIGDNVLSVDVVDRHGMPRRLEHHELGYGYRRSRLQSGEHIVTAIRFRFERADPSALRREAIDILRSRRAKFPKVRANCGSVFVSDPKLYSLIGPPGLAIEKAGLKGFAIGDAQFSPEHANFIVNNDSARSQDVLALIALARSRVYDLTGIAMNAEVRHLSPDGTMRPAHEVAPAAG
ncbi:UDP-N-acetylmuramate dehydrogenase [Sphingomonas sp. 37zxx]|uniref:UDP-N-acetylmuramate dehydrogenase n=1 Tax=Sphingomonas sp. 37zxx TaxID=1550073 RepID=UPI000A81BE2F|nr:UDP-N-acetylmuramate dehydrogenase [Sphingomonas sp. 37zxx]